MATRFQFPDEDWSSAVEDAGQDASLKFAGTFSGASIDARGLVGPIGVVIVGFLVVDETQTSAANPPPGGATGGKTYVY